MINHSKLINADFKHSQINSKPVRRTSTWRDSIKVTELLKLKLYPLNDSFLLVHFSGITLFVIPLIMKYFYNTIIKIIKIYYLLLYFVCNFIRFYIRVFYFGHKLELKNKDNMLVWLFIFFLLVTSSFHFLPHWDGGRE